MLKACANANFTVGKSIGGGNGTSPTWYYGNHCDICQHKSKYLEKKISFQRVAARNLLCISFFYGEQHCKTYRSENEALMKSMVKFPLIFLYTYPTKKDKTVRGNLFNTLPVRHNEEESLMGRELSEICSIGTWGWPGLLEGTEKQDRCSQK